MEIHHHHYSEPQSPPKGVAGSMDLTGPALFAIVNRDYKGNIEAVNGLNLTLGYSWKTYLQPKNQLSLYRTVGTVGLIIPHIEFGIDYRTKMLVPYLTTVLCTFRSLTLTNPIFIHIFLSPRSVGTPTLVAGVGLSYFLLPSLHLGFYG